MHSVSIVGIGRLGGALAIALARAGVKIDALVHRSSERIDVVAKALGMDVVTTHVPMLDSLTSDVVIIATADPDIRPTAEQIAPLTRDGAVVLHTSGSLSSDELSGFASERNPTGSMHPLVSVSDPIAGADKFSDAFFCVEGAEPAVAAARSIVGALGGKSFSIDSQHKPLYHAAAVMSAGHVVALFDVAIEMLAKAGVEHPHEVLLPLILSAVENLETQPTDRALTGSFVRGDVAAVRRHLAAIDESMPSCVREIYILLGERSLELAAKTGLDEQNTAELEKLISMAKRKSGC